MEKTNREIALEWWNTLTEIGRNTYFNDYKYYCITICKHQSELTGREIEIIYKKFRNLHHPNIPDLNIGDIIKYNMDNDNVEKIYQISESELSELLTKVNETIYNVLEKYKRECKVSYISNAVNETIKSSLH